MGFIKNRVFAWMSWNIHYPSYGSRIDTYVCVYAQGVSKRVRKQGHRACWGGSSTHLYCTYLSLLADAVGHTRPQEPEQWRCLLSCEWFTHWSCLPNPTSIYKHATIVGPLPIDLQFHWHIKSGPQHSCSCDTAATDFQLRSYSNWFLQ